MTAGIVPAAKKFCPDTISPDINPANRQMDKVLSYRWTKQVSDLKTKRAAVSSPRLTYFVVADSIQVG
jgi:hypothetical protein